MSSHPSVEPRRVPQQKRGQRRVAGLLRAAACVIADSGYESTTMCAIAKRAGASIGSLYQFFPNKEAVAEALRAAYIGEVEALWASLALKAPTLSAEALVSEIVSSHVKFAKSHRAFVALLEAPPTVNTWQRRALIRDRIARVLMARKPRSSRKRAMQAGAVVHQVVKGLLALYARATVDEKEALTEEFKAVLLGYLGPKL